MTTVTGSLAYRRNVAAIEQGRVPDKYMRLLPYIRGRSILEIGAAEGVLALVLADRDPGATVTALELDPARHAVALGLQAQWRALGRRVGGCTMQVGDVRDRLDLLTGVETVVAIRAIYHWGDAIPTVFQAIEASAVSRVVLAGNPNRARWFADAALPDGEAVGARNYYAGVDGMVSVLEGAGFTIGQIVREGDPIVTGQR